MDTCLIRNVFIVIQENTITNMDKNPFGIGIQVDTKKIGNQKDSSVVRRDF